MDAQRRDLLKAAAVSAVGATSCKAAGAAAAAAAGRSIDAVPRRALGTTGLQVSALGLGGSHLGETKTEDEAIRIVHEAIEAGINFIDNAWEYHDGISEARVGKALKGKRDQVVVMTKVCTHGRDAKVAMRQLEESLTRLGTDHVDLWQVHECIYDNDPDRHFAPEGVMSALDKAKQQGKARFVGFTGHKRPDIHLKMLSFNYPFSTCQLPLNCFDASFRSFEHLVLPELGRRGIAAIGMKSLGGNGQAVTKGAVTVEEALRYAMSLPVATTVSGIDSVTVLRQNLAIARGFRPLDAQQLDALRVRCAPEASDGRFELYKTTMLFDAKEGREQHGFPTKDELPL
jgi:aryl-alcohol dehydrogenase-like predicted oxidoreductase